MIHKNYSLSIKYYAMVKSKEVEKGCGKMANMPLRKEIVMHTLNNVLVELSKGARLHTNIYQITYTNLIITIS